jgi:hypothetical protein
MPFTPEALATVAAEFRRIAESGDAEQLRAYAAELGLTAAEVNEVLSFVGYAASYEAGRQRFLDRYVPDRHE